MQLNQTDSFSLITYFEDNYHEDEMMQKAKLLRT